MSSLLTIGEAARLLGLSVKVLRGHAERGTIRHTTTTGGHRRFDRTTLLEDWSRFATPAPSPDAGGDRWFRRLPLKNLAEDDVWRELRAWIEERTGELSGEARAILAYGVTETINNAIDHSRGSSVTVIGSLAARRVQISVSDDGVGAFATMREGLQLPDDAAAVVEITKGKRTTAPDRHAGEGLFFTSKAVDVFDIEANGYRLVVDNLIGDVATGDGTSTGTTARMILSLDTNRSLADVFARFTDEDLSFVKTAPVIKLISRDGEFISRSEAKRFAAGLEKFAEVTLDFDGLDLIGQGFADELFRVWRRAHPEVVLHVENAGRGVALMIGRVDRTLLDAPSAELIRRTRRSSPEASDGGQ